MSENSTEPPAVPEVQDYIYRPWRWCPYRQRRLYASEYGRKAWKIPVFDD